MLWRGLSWLLHPIWLPMVSAALLFRFQPFLHAHFPAQMAWRIAGSIGLFTAVVPGILLLMMRSLGWVESLNVERRSDRKFLLFVSVVAHYFSFQLLKNSVPVSAIHVLLLGSLVATALTFLVNLIYKISLHAVGWGGMAGMVIGLWPTGILYFFLVFCSALLSGGLALTARRALGAHSWGEIGLGYLLGFSVFAFCFQWFG